MIDFTGTQIRFTMRVGKGIHSDAYQLSAKGGTGLSGSKMTYYEHLIACRMERNNYFRDICRGKEAVTGRDLLRRQHIRMRTSHHLFTDRLYYHLLACRLARA